MIRKLLAVAGLSMLSIVAVPAAAQAYTAPGEADLVLEIDVDDIVIGETQVPFELQDMLPGSEARVSVSAPGVSGDDIAIEITSGGEATEASARGRTGAVFALAILDTTDAADTAYVAGATGSGSVLARVGADGTFGVGVVFPEPANYTVMITGFDKDGTPITVSLALDLGDAGGGGGGGDDGEGLPFTGFNSLTALVAGGGLALLGAGAIIVSRRSRESEHAHSDA